MKPIRRITTARPTKRHWLAGILVVAATGLAVVAVGGSGWAASPTLAPAPPLSTDELLAKIKEPESGSTDEAISIASQLWQRRNEIGRETLITNLVDKTTTQQSREFMIDLLAGEAGTPELTEDVRGLLTDERLEDDLKARIVAKYSFESDDAALLGKLVNQSDGILSFQALKALGRVDAARARGFARHIVDTAEGQSDIRLSAAYKVLIRAGDGAQATEGAALVKHLASVLASPDASRDLKDSAFFALSEIKSRDSLLALMDDTGSDPALVGGAIDENAAMLRDLLSEDASQPTVEFVVRAMELHPIMELAAPLRDATKHVQSNALLARIEKVIEQIEREGIPLNPKWTED